jgi:hypothetical protein
VIIHSLLSRQVQTHLLRSHHWQLPVLPSQERQQLPQVEKLLELHPDYSAVTDQEDLSLTKMQNVADGVANCSKPLQLRSWDFGWSKNFHLETPAEKM